MNSLASGRTKINYLIYGIAVLTVCVLIFGGYQLYRSQQKASEEALLEEKPPSPVAAPFGQLRERRQGLKLAKDTEAPAKATVSTTGSEFPAYRRADYSPQESLRSESSYRQLAPSPWSSPNPLYQSLPFQQSPVEQVPTAQSFSPLPEPSAPPTPSAPRLEDLTDVSESDLARPASEEASEEFHSAGSDSSFEEVEGAEPPQAMVSCSINLQQDVSPHRLDLLFPQPNCEYRVEIAGSSNRQATNEEIVREKNNLVKVLAYLTARPALVPRQLAISNLWYAVEDYYEDVTKLPETTDDRIFAPFSLAIQRLELEQLSSRMLSLIFEKGTFSVPLRVKVLNCEEFSLATLINAPSRVIQRLQIDHCQRLIIPAAITDSLPHLRSGAQTKAPIAAITKLSLNNIALASVPFSVLDSLQANLLMSSLTTKVSLLQLTQVETQALATVEKAATLSVFAVPAIRLLLDESLSIDEKLVWTALNFVSAKVPRLHYLEIVGQAMSLELRTEGVKNWSTQDPPAHVPDQIMIMVGSNSHQRETLMFPILVDRNRPAPPPLNPLLVIHDSLLSEIYSHQISNLANQAYQTTLATLWPTEEVKQRGRAGCGLCQVAIYDYAQEKAFFNSGIDYPHYPPCGDDPNNVVIFPCGHLYHFGGLKDYMKDVARLRDQTTRLDPVRCRKCDCTVPALSIYVGVARIPVTPTEFRWGVFQLFGPDEHQANQGLAFYPRWILYTLEAEYHLPSSKPNILDGLQHLAVYLLPRVQPPAPLYPAVPEASSH